MSDAGTTTPSAGDKPVEVPFFTEKETRLLIAAMQSLKGGPPEVDMQRFQKFGGFNALKTAQNQWGTLKKKIALANPEAAEAAAAAAAAGKTPKTPKAKATPKRKKADDADKDAEESSPKKKVKTPDNAEDDTAAGEETGSPKKKKAPRATKTPAKKAAAKKPEVVAKEDTETEEVKTEAAGDDE